MSDLRISDAPLLPQDQINDFVKLPTGGEGNYSLQLSDLAWYVIADNVLADIPYVNQSVSTVNSALQTHIADKANPHQVTKAQVGLDQVNNTADLDKPVSNATQSAIITAVNGLATNEYVDSLVSHKADKSTTLVGYGITDSYTKGETDVKIANKTVNTLSVDSNDLLQLKLGDNTTKSVDLTTIFDNGISRGVDDSHIIVRNGQVIRTVHDKNQELLSVKDFGAKGDGFTDDTEALKLAFNSGESIFMPDGEYLYSQLTVNTDLKITGTGILKYSGVASTEAATLIFNKGLIADNLNIVTNGSSDNVYNLAIFTADNVTIGNLILTSNVLRNQRGGCEFYGSNIRIDNVISENIARPLAFTNEATDLQLWRTNIHLGKVLIKNYIRGIKFRCVDNLSVVTANITGEWEGLVTKPGYNGILNENVKNATFGNLFIADSAEHAFRFGGDGVTDGWQIANLYAKDTRGCGFKIAPTPPFKVSNGKIGSITGENIGKWDLTGNNEGVRITNAENLEISNVVILKQCSKAVSLADVTNLQINNITVESAAARVLVFDMAQDMASGNCSNITINNLVGSCIKETARYAVELYYQDGRSIDNLQIHSAVVSGYSVAAVSAENTSITNSFINVAINSAEVQNPFYGLTDAMGIHTTAKLGDNIFFGKAKNAYGKGFVTADSTPFNASSDTNLSSVFVSSLSATASQNAYGGWLGFGRLQSSRRGGAITIQQTGATEAKNGLAFFTQNNTTVANEALQATLLLKHNGVLNAPQMPTSPTGLVKGDIWNDAGTLKIIP